MPTGASPVIPGIVERHADEASFLWGVRDAAVERSDLTLTELARLDDRLDAHVDGLRVGGELGWKTSADALADGNAGGLFAAAVLAFESGDASRVQAVLEDGVASIDLQRALISALGWLRWDSAEPAVMRLLASDPPTTLRVGIAACAAHRLDPGDVLDRALASEDADLATRALEAVGELGLLHLLPEVRRHLSDRRDAVRFAAAWSAGLLGERAAIPVLGAFALGGGPRATRACDVALRVLPLTLAHTAWREMRDRPELQRLAVYSAGVIGDPAYVGYLLDRMGDPLHARIAGEAFTSITGVDLAGAGLDTPPPEEAHAGPTENPDDDRVALGSDENLPWRSTDAVRSWWNDVRSEFHAGERYLLGRPITPEWLAVVLREGRQRHRIAAALELAIASPGQPLFETRAPGYRQQYLLFEE